MGRQEKPLDSREPVAIAVALSDGAGEGDDDNRDNEEWTEEGNGGFRKAFISLYSLGLTHPRHIHHHHEFDLSGWCWGVTTCS